MNIRLLAASVPLLLGFAGSLQEALLSRELSATARAHDVGGSLGGKSTVSRPDER